MLIFLFVFLMSVFYNKLYSYVACVFAVIMNLFLVWITFSTSLVALGCRNNPFLYLILLWILGVPLVQESMISQFEIAIQWK